MWNHPYIVELVLWAIGVIITFTIAYVKGGTSSPSKNKRLANMTISILWPIWLYFCVLETLIDSHRGEM